MEQDVYVQICRIVTELLNNHPPSISLEDMR